MPENNNRTTEKVLFGVLSVLLLVFVFNVYTKKLSTVQTVLGEDEGGSEEQSSPSSDEDEDEDEDKNEDKDEDENSGKDEDVKSETETSVVKSGKKQSGSESKSSKTTSSDELSGTEEELSEEENELADEQSETEGSESKDTGKILAKLEKEIVEAEEEIAEKQGEGVVITAAQARIAETKTLLEAVKVALAAGDYAKAESLSKQVRKLAHFAKEKDLHDAKEVSKEMDKIAKRINQTYGKIALLESVGGNASTFRSTLASYEAELKAMQAKVAAGGLDVATLEGEQEVLERKVKRLKSSVESTLYALGNTDEEFDDDIERETEFVVASLRSVAGIEGEDGEVGKTITTVAKEQEVSASRKSSTVAAIDKRNPVLQTLFGTDRDDIAQLETEVAANQARITALLKAANAIEDAEVKAILLEQVELLETETKKLDTFATAQKDRTGVFGWFFNLF